METAFKTEHAVDLSVVARNLELPESQVRAAAGLLHQGNTIPFITRYRRDATSGLNERQLLNIQEEISRLTALAERKSIILKSIENQDKLSDTLRQQIEQATQSRQLEDLYLPFKPRKPSLATTARQQGLEPLARDILEARTNEIDLPTRAAEFVRVDRGLSTVDEVFAGVKHILAERFSEHLKLRRALRKLFWETGTVETRLIEPKPAISPANEKPGSSKSAAIRPAGEPPPTGSIEPVAAIVEPQTESAGNSPVPQVAVDPPGLDAAGDAPPDAQPLAGQHAAVPDPVPDAGPAADTPAADTPAADTPAAESAAPEPGGHPAAPPVNESGIVSGVPAEPELQPGNGNESGPGAPSPVATGPPPAAAPSKKKKRKKKKKKSRPDPFAEYATFSQPVQKIPPHRVLAINRGERAGRIQIRIAVDESTAQARAHELLVPADHPYAEILNQAADEALQRFILPAVERELWRELLERSETHAVRVFARNLRNLILQQPVRGHRIMGIDPGYRSGCKVAVIDATGRPLGTGVFSIVGNDERKKTNQRRLAELLNEFRPSLIALGNGSGCHAVEHFVADVLEGDFADSDIRYAIVNQAGTSSYSTSEIAREELPDYDPLIRSAISIARRLQDPLSELVKVQPANIGVGMFQHDIRAKHLADILQQEVEFCVNLVGVDVNTASVALLRHVSALGPLTARRLVEHRDQHGAFSDRQALREVPGMGDVTWNQAIGFLRIEDSSNLLDRTGIHPESYEVVQAFLKRIDANIEDLFVPEPVSREKTARTTATGAATASGQPSHQPPETTGQPADPPVAGDPTAVTGDPTAVTGDPTAVAGDPPAVTGDPTAVTGDPTAVAGDPPAVTGDPPAVAGDRPAVADISPARRAELRNRRDALAKRIRAIDPVDMAQQLGVGEMTLRDILRALRNPTHDPRENLPAPIFRSNILKLEDLKPGQALRGQVVNVVDFGVFVNIGMGDSCLVHISRLSNRFIRDPHWHFAVGDVLDVWVQNVDLDKKRVTLTAIRPAQERPPRGAGRSSGSRQKPASARSGSDRRPARSGQRGGGPRGRHPHSGSTSQRRPHKPKPVTPITEEMVEGKAPMRSFSDLMQFHKRKSSEDPESSAD